MTLLYLPEVIFTVPPIFTYASPVIPSSFFTMWSIISNINSKDRSPSPGGKKTEKVKGRTSTVSRRGKGNQNGLGPKTTEGDGERLRRVSFRDTFGRRNMGTRSRKIRLEDVRREKYT